MFTYDPADTGEVEERKPHKIGQVESSGALRKRKIETKTGWYRDEIAPANLWLILLLINEFGGVFLFLRRKFYGKNLYKRFEGKAGK